MTVSVANAWQPGIGQAEGLNYTHPGTGAVEISLKEILDNMPAIPQMFNAAADNVTDDSTELSNLLNSGQGIVTIPPGDYAVSGNITISNSVHVLAYGATFNWPSDTSANRGIIITASNVTIEGLEVVGPQFATKVSTQKGILATGTDNDPAAPTNLTDIKIINCKASNWGMYGINLTFVDGFEVRGCKVEDCEEGGIVGLSAVNGVIDGNYIDNITNSSAAWGITMTRNTAGDFTRRPLPRDIRITNNYVSNVTGWTGIDCHGGDRVSMIGNQVYDCFRGCTLAIFDNGTNIQASRDCKIIGNTMVNEGIATTAMGSGIVVSGSTSSFGNRNTVIGNTVKGFGDSDGTLGGTNTPSILVLYNTILNMDANTIQNAGRIGLELFGLGPCNSVTNTIIRDIVGTGGQGIRIDPTGQTSECFIAGGVIDVAGHTAIFCEEDTAVKIGHIDFQGYSNITDHTGGATIAGQYLDQWLPVVTGETTWDPASIAAGSSASTTVSSVPGCSGACSVDVSFNRDLQGMTYQVVSGDTDKNVGAFTIYLYNNTSGAIDLASMKVKYKVELRNP